MTMAFDILTTGHSVNGLLEGDVAKLADPVGRRLTLQYTKVVHDRFYAFPGIHIIDEHDLVIGWVPKAFFEEHINVFANNFGLKRFGDTCRARIQRTYRQSTGRIGLVLRYGEAGLDEISQRLEAKTEAPTKMKLPTLQEMIATNTAAVGTAAQLETGRVANKQLAKIVGKKLKPEHAALLESPLGQIVLANGVILLGKSVYPDNPLLKKVSNAMLVTAIQDLLAGFDIPGVIEELLSSKDVLKAAMKEEAGSGVIG